MTSNRRDSKSEYCNTPLIFKQGNYLIDHRKYVVVINVHWGVSSVKTRLLRGGEGGDSWLRAIGNLQERFSNSNLQYMQVNSNQYSKTHVNGTRGVHIHNAFVEKTVVESRDSVPL